MLDILKLFVMFLIAILLISFISGVIAFALDIIRYKSTFDGAMKRDDLLERLMFDVNEQPEAPPEEPAPDIPRKEYDIDVS